MRIAILTGLIITYPSLIYRFHPKGIRSSWKKPTYCTHIVHQMLNFLELWKHKRNTILISERQVGINSVVISLLSGVCYIQIANKKYIICNLFTHGAPWSSQELVQKCPCIPGSKWNLVMLDLEERKKHLMSSLINILKQRTATYKTKVAIWPFVTGFSISMT